MNEPETHPVVEAVQAGFARSDRVFWLDGGGSRDWSGRRSLVGVLDEDDVSLTFDAATGEVTRHQGDRDEVVGTDVFAVLEDEIARDAGDPDVHWVGCFGYASRPDLPRAAVGASGPTRCGCGVRTSSSSTTNQAWFRDARRRSLLNHRAAHAPDWYAEGFDRVQEQLRAGNTYEVNLTYREDIGRADDPLATYLRLRATNPAPYAGLLRHRGTHLLSSSPERYATIDRRRWLETKPIKGTTPRGAHGRGGRTPASHSWPPTRSPAPRT